MKYPSFIKKKTLPMPSLDQRIQFLELMVDYFEKNVKTHSLFLPEYQISKEIFNIITSSEKEQTEKNNVIVYAYNRISEVEHYNGTGWFDFTIRLSGYFETLGYKADFNREKGAMALEKM